MNRSFFDKFFPVFRGSNFLFKRKVILLQFIIISGLIYAQQNPFSQLPHEWESYKPIKIPDGVKNYAKSDLICINEKTDFVFYSNTDQKILKSTTILINSDFGAEKIKSYSLPESYDIAFDEDYYKQGRRSKINIPFIAHYKILNFAVRRQRSNHWTEMAYQYKVDGIKWISQSGEFVKDDITSFQFDDLKVGDILEIYYESEFGTIYGSNLFYFNSKYPKLNCEYNFIYKVSDRFADFSFILPVNIKDSLVLSSTEPLKDYKMIRKSITLTNLEAMNYPENAFESKQFPYVYADFRFYKIATGSYPDGSNRYIEYDYIRPKHFEWMIIRDTTNDFTKIYDKQFASIRQFSSKLPKVTNDSTKIIFFKALSDTLNSFNFINSNNLFYNKSELYNLYSGDHLLKRRLVEHLVWKLTKDILNENKIYYYRANIQDNRYGEHSMRYRANYSYENYLIAIPVNNTFIYFVPRTNGVTYFLNELPFYYEGSLAALTAKNYQETDKNKEANYFKLIKTHKGTSSENSRIENATININTDSLIANLTIRESLSGQFSTILRHYYQNTYIDSTIAPFFFRKCTDKPKASNVKIKLSTKITEYPFRFNFNCSEKINIESKTTLSLKDWFSFPIALKSTNEIPNHDYYFDFEFTDSYNYLVNFSKPTIIENTMDAVKKLENETFSLVSEIIKQSDTTYLIKVELKVKTRKLDKVNGADLLKLTSALKDLNDINFKLK